MAKGIDYRCRLTVEQREQIVKLFIQGFSQSRISLLFGVDRSTVRYHLARASVYRKGFKRRVFTTVTDEVIEPLHNREEQTFAETRLSDEEYLALAEERIRRHLEKRNASEGLIKATIAAERETILHKPRVFTYVDYVMQDNERRGVQLTRDTVLRQIRRRRSLYGSN